MNKEMKEKYVEYIAKGLRFALKETRIKDFPEGLIICVQVYSPLAKIDSILDIPIYVTNITSCSEFFISFLSINEDKYSLLKSFKEYLELYNFKLEENN